MTFVVSGYSHDIHIYLCLYVHTDREEAICIDNKMGLSVLKASLVYTQA